MILIDANVPMYLVGTEHRNKTAAMQLLERAVNDRERLVTDAEVFQEMLHRYVAIDRRDAIEPTFALLRGLVDEVFPITSRECICKAESRYFSAARAPTRILGRL